MSVQMRGAKWHYRFMIAGTIHSGVCSGCINFTQAEKYEAEMRRFVTKSEEDVRRNKTVTALVENYRKELSGGTDITLEEAYDLALQKPSRRPASEDYIALRRAYWSDFVVFIKDKYPNVKYISSIRKSQCEAYVTRLVDEGRYVQALISDCNGGLAPKTVKEYVAACKWVLGRLKEDAGIINNPFDNIVLPAPAPIKREVFTMDELKLIWDGLQKDYFLRPLFVIAANSGMTEGDICTLKWSDIDFLGGMIRRIRRKTGATILLPLLPELAKYLSTIPRVNDYVLPEHARMYLERRQRVPGRVKAFLNNLGIKTTVSRNGIRNVSVKDLHSMRHLFAYRAKKAGIPEAMIAKMVGHEVIEMTRHYADHDTEDDLREQIKKLPALFVGERGDNQGEVERQRLMELIPQLPIEVVRRWLGELSQGLPGTP